MGNFNLSTKTAKTQKPVVIDKKMSLTQNQLNAFMERLVKNKNIAYWEIDDNPTFNAETGIWTGGAVLYTKMNCGYHSIPKNVIYYITLVDVTAENRWDLYIENEAV